MPLPPRNTKPKLIDKRRHIRKYPLKLPDHQKSLDGPGTSGTIIYQNAMSCPIIMKTKHNNESQETGIDVTDARDSVKTGTNPFKSNSNSVNPFNFYVDNGNVELGLYVVVSNVQDNDTDSNGDRNDTTVDTEGTLVKGIVVF